MKRYRITMVVFFILSAGIVLGQNRIKYYDVLYKNKVVGSTVIRKTGDERNFIIMMDFSADIDLFIKKVSIIGKEEARFENSVLKSGSVFRKVNEKIQTDNWIRRSGNNYIVYDGERSSRLSIGEVQGNMLSIFFSEPYNLSRVYADNQQRLVPIQETSPHVYMIPGKNESYSTYIFQNGDCNGVILESKLVTLMLRQR